MPIAPVTLDGHHVRLEPVSLAHVPAEGIFRNHMILPDGRIRHSIYFSVIDDAWPGVKAHLAVRLCHAAA
jgi:hypothetical protein